MKSNLRSWAVVAVFAMMVTGCSIYHPQSVDIPMINHAGDMRVDASVGLSTWVLPDVLTAGATVSYGFNDWLAGQAHLNFGGDNVYGQVAPGAYLPLGDHGLLEGYVGMGMGGAWRSRTVSSSDTSTYNYDYSGRFSIPFGQVNIGWHDLSAAHIDLALALKDPVVTTSLFQTVHSYPSMVDAITGAVYAANVNNRFLSVAYVDNQNAQLPAYPYSTIVRTIDLQTMVDFPRRNIPPGKNMSHWTWSICRPLTGWCCCKDNFCIRDSSKMCSICWM